MMRTDNIFARLSLGLVFLCCMAIRAGAGSAHPNILLVIADQWRAQTFGFAGDPNVKTPHIDALERECVDFTNAISPLPVCCPARASLLTGRRALTHGVFLNDVPLSTNAVSLAKVLQADGYDTGYIGKWHLNGDGRSAFIPRERRQGFEYWKALECTHDYNHSSYYADTPQKLEWPGYDAIAQTHDAQIYLRARATNSRPFFLMLSWGPPHNPYGTAPQKYRAMYHAPSLQLRGNVPAEAAKSARHNAAGYYAHCSALDDCVGQLLATLREAGLESNTIVLFTADHGDMLGSHGLMEKQKPYDESIRVPMLFRCPAELKARARRVGAILCSQDIMPTLLGLCGEAIPGSVQGVDFSGYMRGGADPSDDTRLILSVAPFAEWSLPRGGREYRGLRTTRFTYVRDLRGPWLLFDNARDPLQLTNLVNRPEAAAWQAVLDARLQAKLSQIKDNFRPAGDYVRQWGYTVDTNGTVPYEN